MDRKNGVLKLFQWVFVFRHVESKSRLITCKWARCMLGDAWYPILKSLKFRPITSITFVARSSISSSRFWCFWLNFFQFVLNENKTSKLRYDLRGICWECFRMVELENDALPLDICPLWRRRFRCWWQPDQDFASILVDLVTKLPFLWLFCSSLRLQYY